MGTLNNLIEHLNSFTKEIEKLKTATVEIHPDKNNMIKKECPKDDCKSQFFVDDDDWKNIFRDEEVFCPICKASNLAKKYIPSEYMENVKQQLSQSIKQSWETGSPINVVNYKITIGKELIANYLYNCNSCYAKYGTLVEANLCPSCGAQGIR